MKHELIHKIKHRPNSTASSPFTQKLKKKNPGPYKKDRALIHKKKKKEQKKKGKKKQTLKPKPFFPDQDSYSL